MNPPNYDAPEIPKEQNTNAAVPPTNGVVAISAYADSPVIPFSSTQIAGPLVSGAVTIDSIKSTSISSNAFPTKEKVAFMNMGKSRTEFIAVPYDSERNSDFAEITGGITPRFYTNKSAASKSNMGTDKSKDECEKTRGAKTKDMNDYVFHFYVGSLSIIGLFMLFRIIQKS